MTTEEFVKFGKIPRLAREVIVTEKLDGTNGQILIKDTGEILIGSRNRWITTEDDHHGFARWATEHKDELLMLGPGRHYGEWWGAGINRGYGLPKGEKRFSLFNVIRWCKHNKEPQLIESDDPPKTWKYQQVLPECCNLVSVLWRGIFNTEIIEMCLEDLKLNGSVAVPGYMNPEGVVIYHIAGNVLFKKTLGNDGNKSAC